MVKWIKKIFAKKEVIQPKITVEIYDTYQRLTEALVGLPPNVGHGNSDNCHYVRLPISTDN